MQGNLGLTPVQAPCKGCADRHTGCHTDCTRYISIPPGGGQIQAGAIEGCSEICNNKGLYADAARCEPRKA